MKKVLAILLALAMIFSFAACGGDSGSATTAKKEKKITIVDGEWYGTDPYQQDTWSTVQTLINEPLFSLDPETGALNDSIATGLEVSEDGLTMSFTIPHGKKFASGEEVLAEDIKASLEYGQPISPYGEGWENIETIDADNETGKVVFHLNRFSSDLLYYLGECFIGVLDKDQIESKTQDEMMWGAQCYAPYYVSEYEPGSYVKLKPNPGFKSDNPYVTNKGAMDIDEITVKFNIDDFTVIEEMKNGTVDYWADPSPDAIAQFKDVESVLTPEKNYPSVIFMELNDNEGTLFSDIRLRQAVALLLNRELYTEKTNGAGMPAYSMITDTMLYFDQTAKDDYVKNYCNDKDRALALLAEAGWADTNGDGYLDKDGKTFEYDFYVSTNAVRATVAQAMQEDLKQYGIKMNTQSIDWNYVDEYLYSDNYVAGMHGLSWMEPILILNCMYEDPTYENGMDNDYQWFYDRVTECSSEPDDAKRAVMLGELEMENATLWNMIPVCSYVDHVAYNTRLKGVNILANSFIYWNDLTID